jgi:hypothetical protein
MPAVARNQELASVLLGTRIVGKQPVNVNQARGECHLVFVSKLPLAHFAAKNKKLNVASTIDNGC